MTSEIKPDDRLRLIWNIPAKNYRGKPGTSEDGYPCFARIRKTDNILESVAMRDGTSLSIFCACHPMTGRFAIFRIRYRAVSGHPSYGTLEFPGEGVEIPIAEFRAAHSAVAARVLE